MLVQPVTVCPAIHEISVYSSHPATDHLAQNAAEVFVARVAEETPAVRQHADEAGESPKLTKSFEVVDHAVHLVQEPPGGSVLHFAGAGTVLETTAESSHEGIVSWIEVV